jgi:hypothetical protein
LIRAAGGEKVVDDLDAEHLRIPATAPTLDSAIASQRPTPYSRPSNANIASNASNAAASTVDPSPMVIQPAGVCATGVVSIRSSRSAKVGSTRSMGT